MRTYGLEPVWSFSSQTILLLDRVGGFGVIAGVHNEELATIRVFIRLHADFLLELDL